MENLSDHTRAKENSLKIQQAIKEVVDGQPDAELNKDLKIVQLEALNKELLEAAKKALKAMDRGHAITAYSTLEKAIKQATK